MQSVCLFRACSLKGKNMSTNNEVKLMRILKNHYEEAGEVMNYSVWASVRKMTFEPDLKKKIKLTRSSERCFRKRE